MWTNLYFWTMALMNISAKCTFYVVTHVSHINQIVYINSYSTNPYQAIKISMFTTPQWPHMLGQRCMHRQCRPRFDKGLHYLPYHPNFKWTCYSPCLQHHNDWTYQPYLYGLSCEFAFAPPCLGLETCYRIPLFAVWLELAHIRWHYKLKFLYRQKLQCITQKEIISQTD